MQLPVFRDSGGGIYDLSFIDPVGWLDGLGVLHVFTIDPVRWL
jgi:hypothetical protein